MTPKQQTLDPDDVVDAEVIDDHANAVVPVDPTAVEKAPIVGTNEWDGVDAVDLAPEPATSFLTMIPMNAKMDGGFTDPDTGETGVLEYDFVWLAKGKTRAAFVEVVDGEIRKLEYNAKNPEGPGCRSFNGKTADQNSPLLQNGGDCTTCPLAQWRASEPPLCKEAVTAMAFIPDASGGRLASFSFRGLSVAPAKRYWRSFDERLPVIPPIAYVTHVALEPTETDNGRFLAAHFERGTQLTRAEAQPLIDERTRRLTEWQKVVEADVVTSTGDSGAGPFDSDSAAKTVPAGVDADGNSTEEF